MNPKGENRMTVFQFTQKYELYKGLFLWVLVCPSGHMSGNSGYSILLIHRVMYKAVSTFSSWKGANSAKVNDHTKRKDQR